MLYSNTFIEFCIENPNSAFKGLNSRDKETITRHHHALNIKKGDFIYREGEKAKGVICLAAGKYKIFRVGVGGREQILKFMRPGEMAGIRNIFQTAVWNDSAIAIEDSVICMLDKNTLTGILKNNPDLSIRIIKLVADELAFARNRIISLTQKHLRGRVVETLLMLGDLYGFENDGRTINVSLSRDDIAHHSNMTTSNAIRTLSNLASEGKIGLKRRKITLIDIPALEMISNAG
ncbi:MAG TPA: Crp/Fnr family transcriptional regulator [Bacteroidales bacterium]|nr:Crp/Fnr family transcriptional regulator [Bacteroidales bacterium]